jgi:hypothetical protein
LFIEFDYLNLIKGTIKKFKKSKETNMTNVKKAYVDIEATYCGDIDPDRSREDKEKFFRDFPNWKFYCEKEHKEKKVRYQGILGILILEFDYDENTGLYKFLDKRFVQLKGPEITKEKLMGEIQGVNEIIGYHCRTKPAGPKGYIGYDFGVIGSQLGIILDEIPGVKCIDIELLAHGAQMYGGLKAVEMMVPTVPTRKSGIEDGKEVEKLLHDIAACDNEGKKKQMWKKALRYNREDVFNLVFIEQYLRKLRITE